MTAARARCWCGRPIPARHVPHGVVDCAEHDDRTSAPTPITHAMTKPQAGPSPVCLHCGGDLDAAGFLFHIFEGTAELIGPCPNPLHRSRQESAA